MCGLFGFIRNQSSDPSPVSDTFLALGLLAEERGTHAAGLAMATAHGTPTPTVRGDRNDLPDVTADGWRVVKGHGPFRRVWRPRLRDSLNLAPAVLGHTRFATQGAIGHLPNACPLRVGKTIGTHNGDIDVVRLRSRFTLPAPVGRTDTESLLLALDRAAGDIAETLEVLAAAVGRTALVWTDHRRPRTVMLARTAVSPLAVALDPHGNFFWATNPAWFTAAVDSAGGALSRSDVTPLLEGTLLVVDYTGGQPRIAERHTFAATARHLDEDLAPRVAYLGFDHADRVADQNRLTHRTVPDHVR